MAITNIGGIGVKITADIDGWQASMNRVKKDISDVSKQIRSGVNDYGRWAAAGVAAATAVGAAMVKSSAQSIDALAKTSDRLGLTTQALSGLQYAAQLTGADISTLNMALQRMTRRVAEAAQGTGEAKDAIKELGLDAQALARLSPDEQFKALAEAMSNVANQGDRVRLAMKLFDSEGVKLVNTLALGSDELERLRTEAEQMGVALSRFDASQIEEMNDAILRVDMAFSGVINQLTVQLSPIITDIANRITETTKRAGGFGETFSSAINHIVRGVGIFADGLHGIHVLLQGVAVAGAGLRKIWAESMRVMTTGFEQFINFGVRGLNQLIYYANMIPGVALPSIEQFTLGAAEFFTNMSNEAGAALTGMTQDWHELAMTPIPSEQLDLWLAKIQDEVLPKMQEYQRKATEIDAKGAEDRGKIAEKEAQQKRDVYSSMFGNLSSLMNTESRRMFEIGKTAAIAGALVDGYAAVVGAYKVGAKLGGPPLGAAFAATAGLATAAQIQQISNTKFGSASTGQSYSGGQVVNNTAPQAEQRQPDQNISINLVGGQIYTADQIRGLIGAINEQTGDGVRLSTSG